MALSFALNNADSTLTITTSTDQLRFSDPDSLFTGYWSAFRDGNDLHIDFDGKGEVIIVNQFVTPLVPLFNFDDEQNVTFRNALTGTATAEFIIGTAADESINGGGGDDILLGGGGNDSITGGTADDMIMGGDGDDLLTGNGGDDEFSPGSGNDTVDGSGADAYAEVSYAESEVAITVNFSGEEVGGQAANTVIEQAGSPTTDILTAVERVTGTAFDDTFYGGRLMAWDWTNPDLEVDQTAFNGRGGNDHFVAYGNSMALSMGVEYEYAMQGVIVNLGDDQITVDGVVVDAQTALDGEGGTDTFDLTAGVRVDIGGSRFNDYLVGRTSYWADLEGGAGNDTLVGGGTGAIAAYWDSPWPENGMGIIANLSASSISYGGVTVASNNVRDNFGDTDTLLNITGIYGSEYADYIVGSDDGNVIYGGDGNDTIRAGAGMDEITAGTGVDIVDAGSESDILKLEGNRTEFTVVRLGAAEYRLTKIAGEDSVDITVRNVEQFQFWDAFLGAEELLETGSTYQVGSDVSDTLTGAAANDTLDGLDGNDSLDGGSANDLLIGGLGDDTMTGGAGNDTFDVDSVGDSVIETVGTGTGTDTIRTALNSYSLSGLANVENLTFVGEGNFVGSGNTSNNVITGSFGNDTLNGLSGSDTLIGGTGNDRYVIDLATDVIVEGVNEGTDTVDIRLNVTTYTVGSNIENATIANAGSILTLTGNALNNSLFGNAANNILNGGAGSDFMQGGAGNDTIDGGVITDRLNYSDGNSVGYADAGGSVTINLSGITGNGSTGQGSATGTGIGTDVLKNISYVRGSSSGDLMTGSSALTIESFEGGVGDDTIDGGAITDTLNGTNSNRLSYQNAAGAVEVNLAAGAASGADGNDTFANINMVRASEHDDSLTGSDREDITEHFEGRAGNDTIDGAGGLDQARYENALGAVNVDLATGTADDGYGTTDTLSNIEGVRGSAFDDTLTGGNAASDEFEFFMGMAGDDIIDGGSGYDRADYNLATEAVNVTLGGAGNGTAVGGSSTGSDTLISIEGVRGSTFNDTLTGSDDADVYETFAGKEGNDVIDGRGGVDRVDYHISTAAVNVNLQAGTAADGYGGTDTLSHIEDVRGSTFNDTLTGNGGDNLLLGEAGNDSLAGGSGNDSLAGGAGN
ncbi:MAG TPA: hypothetical protein VF096_09645, partial [Azonexus sp.]